MINAWVSRVLVWGKDRQNGHLSDNCRVCDQVLQGSKSSLALTSSHFCYSLRGRVSLKKAREFLAELL